MYDFTHCSICGCFCCHCLNVIWFFISWLCRLYLCFLSENDITELRVHWMKSSDMRSVKSTAITFCECSTKQTDEKNGKKIWKSTQNLNIWAFQMLNWYRLCRHKTEYLVLCGFFILIKMQQTQKHNTIVPLLERWILLCTFEEFK